MTNRLWISFIVGIAAIFFLLGAWFSKVGRYQVTEIGLIGGRLNMVLVTDTVTGQTRPLVWTDGEHAFGKNFDEIPLKPGIGESVFPNN